MIAPALHLLDEREFGGFGEVISCRISDMDLVGMES